jgi:hypothetical protein
VVAEKWYDLIASAKNRPALFYGSRPIFLFRLSAAMISDGPYDQGTR